MIDTFPPENAGGIVLINTSECLILLGSVVGCFEGIGLVLPIEVIVILGGAYGR